MTTGASGAEDEAKLEGYLRSGLEGLLAALETGPVIEAYGWRQEVGEDLAKLLEMRAEYTPEKRLWLSKVQRLVDTVSVLDLGWVVPAQEVRALLGMKPMVRKEDAQKA